MREKLTSVLGSIESQPYYELRLLPAKELITLRNDAKATKDTLIAEMAQWEIDACTVYPQGMTRRVKKEYRTAESVNTWGKERMLYYLTRFRECKQLQLKCNYGEFILDCRGEGRLGEDNKYEVFVQLVPSLIQKGRLDLEKCDDKIFRCHSVSGALEWSLAFSNSQYVVMCIDELMSLLKTADHQDGRVQLSEVLDILMVVQEHSKFKHLLHPHINTILGEMEKAKNAFQSSHDYLSFNDILDKYIDWYKALGRPKEEIRQVTLEKGEAFIQRAELEEEYILKGMLIDDAIKLFISMGEKSRLNELSTKKREYLRIAERDEMGHISIPIPVSEEAIKYLATYETLSNVKDILTRMMGDPNLMPDNQQDPESSPMSLIMSSIMLNDGRIVGRSSSPEENLDFQRNQVYLLELQYVANFFIGRIFDIAIARGLKGQDILDIYSSWEFHNRHREMILANGFDKFAKRDYIAAVHILAPQFEACLREMFEAVGIPAVAQRDGADKEQVLSKFLERPEVRKPLSEQFARFIEMVLIAPEGWNIRNDVAHGIISPSAFTLERAGVILLLYLRLFTFHKVKTNNTDTGQQDM